MNVLPAGWQSATLGTVLPVRYGRGLTREARLAGDISVYGSSGVVGFHNRALTGGPTILIGRKGNVGSVYLSPGPCWPIDTVYYAEGTASICLSFFKHLLEHLGLSRLDRSTAVPGLTLGDYDRASVLVPPLAEQRRIVAEIEKQFTRLNNALASVESSISKMQRARTGLLGGAIAVGVARCSEHAPSCDSPELGPYVLSTKTPPDPQVQLKVPCGWRLMSLDQLTTRITSGSRDWSPYYGRGTGTFILAQNIRPRKLDLEKRQRVDPPDNDASRNRSAVQQGDVLVTIVGANTGDVCVVEKCLPEHYVCQSVALMRPVVPGLAKFLAFYLSDDRFGRAIWHRYIYGAGRPHLSFEQLRKTPILVPPRDQLQELTESMEYLDSLVTTAAASAKIAVLRASRLRQAILAKAFSGHLVPQDPNDEPASVLLERIRTERIGSAKPRQGSLALTKTK